MNRAQEFVNSIKTTIELNWKEKLLEVVQSMVILVLAYFIGVFIRSVIISSSKSLATSNQNHNNKTLLIFAEIADFTYYAIMFIALFMIFNLFGIETVSLVALLGAMGFGIGLALQGTFSDVAAGMILASVQTFSIGDLIQVGDIVGTVVDFTLIMTIIEDVATGIRTTIPNHVVQASIVMNHNRPDVRFAVIDVALSNRNNNISDILDALHTMLSSYPGVLHDPAPAVSVLAMDKAGTMIRTKCAIHNYDYPVIMPGLRTAIRKTLEDSNAMLLDYPQSV